MLKIVARYRIKNAIRFHENKRYIIEHMHGYPGMDISWFDYIERTGDYMWHLAACEYRCAERLKNLLKKYQ